MYRATERLSHWRNRCNRWSHTQVYLERSVIHKTGSGQASVLAIESCWSISYTGYSVYLHLRILARSLLGTTRFAHTVWDYIDSGIFCVCENLIDLTPRDGYCMPSMYFIHVSLSRMVTIGRYDVWGSKYRIWMVYWLFMQIELGELLIKYLPMYWFKLWSISRYISVKNKI